VGSPNSSNSNRLRELAERCGASAYLVDSAAEVQKDWLVGAKAIGVTAGASAPEVLVQQVILRLQQLTEGQVDEIPGEVETITFSMPKMLR